MLLCSVVDIGIRLQRFGLFMCRVSHPRQLAQQIPFGSSVVTTFRFRRFLL